MLASHLDRWLWRIPRRLPAHPQTRRVVVPGAQLRLRDSGGPGPVLVFLCDPPVSVEAYDALIAQFAPARRVLVLELPGFGFSRVDSAAALEFAGAVAAVEAALLALDTGPLVLCAPCICAFVAGAVAAREQVPLAGVVLMQAPDAAGMQAWTERMDPRGLLRRPLLGQALVRANARRLARFWLRYASAPDADIDDLREACLTALRRGGGYPLATMLQDWGQGVVDRPLTPPAIAVWGLQDRSHQCTQTLCTRAHVPSGQLLEMEHCGHFPELEDPAGFAAVIDDFLNACLPLEAAAD